MQKYLKSRLAELYIYIIYNSYINISIVKDAAQREMLENMEKSSEHFSKVYITEVSVIDPW